MIARVWPTRGMLSISYETVKQLRLDVLSWLKADHPSLYPEGYQ
jgi:hypothetical protein